MDKGDAVTAEHPLELLEIRANSIILRMYQRVKTEHEIDGVVRHHWQRVSVVRGKPGAFVSGEALLASCYAVIRKIHAEIGGAVRQEVLCPAAEAWAEFEK